MGLCSRSLLTISGSYKAILYVQWPEWRVQETPQRRPAKLRWPVDTVAHSWAKCMAEPIIFKMAHATVLNRFCSHCTKCSKYKFQQWIKGMKVFCQAPPWAPLFGSLLHCALSGAWSVWSMERPRTEEGWKIPLFCLKSDTIQFANRKLCDKRNFKRRSRPLTCVIHDLKWNFSVKRKRKRIRSACVLWSCWVYS